MKQRSKQIHTSIHAYLFLLRCSLNASVIDYDTGPAATPCRLHPNLGLVYFLGCHNTVKHHPQRNTFTGLDLYIPMIYNYYSLSWIYPLTYYTYDGR